MQHFLTIDQLQKSQLEQLLQDAASFLNEKNKIHIPLEAANILKSHYVTGIFLEASTRTRTSFEMATRNLNGHFNQFDTTTSSFTKGETLLDTLLTLEAMGNDFFVVRLKEEGLLAAVAPHLQSTSHLICAGEGTTSHPTQALLDMLTIQRHTHKPFSALKVVIAGDIKHSRVARSDVSALTLLGAQSITLVAPPHYQAEDLQAPHIHLTDHLDKALEDADVLILLRIQKERFQNKDGTISDYHSQFGLTPQRLKKLPPSCIIMHPGPINRGVEIAESVLSDPRVCILQQVTYGVAARMAILKSLQG